MLFKTGDLLDSNAEALVIPVNCVGVMGAGLALEAKYKFHDSAKHYGRACIENRLYIGNILIDTINHEVTKYLVYFPTKLHWRENSRLEYIEEGLKTLRSKIINLGIKSIALPRLGCGCGRLNWTEVKQLILKYLNDLEDVDIQIISPPHHYHPHERLDS